MAVSAGAGPGADGDGMKKRRIVAPKYYLKNLLSARALASSQNWHAADSRRLNHETTALTC